MKKISLYIIVSLFGLLSLNSCVDDDYSDPIFETPEFTVPDGGIVKTIAELKKIYRDANPTASNPIMNADLFQVINEDIYVSGFVVSNDEFGNFYKNIVIQGELDGSSEGINISIGESDLNAKFAIGQKVFVKCKGLTLGLYGNNVQIGGGNYWYKFKEFRLAPILSPAISEHIFKDGVIQNVPVKNVTIDNLSDDDRFTLITLENVQFKGADAGTTWGNVEGDHSEVFPFKSTLVEDENGNTLTVFTSNYSDFGSKLTPTGSGTITGILSAHNGEPQLVINSLSDVNMDGDRFGSGTGPGDGDVTYDFNLDFESHTPKTDFAMTDWINFDEKGSQTWYVKEYQGNTYAECSNFGTSDSEMVSWLITPQVNVDGDKYIAFETAMHHWEHDVNDKPLELFYSEDFDGTNVKAATWVKMNIPALPNSTTKWYELVPSGQIALPAGKNIYLALKYSGTDVKTTGIQIDNVRVFKK